METNELRAQAQDLNNQGALLLENGKAQEARKKFDQAIELDPMLASSYENYGNLYMHLEEYENAKNSYKKAMLIEKSGYREFLYGSACFMNDEPHEGIEHYNLAISANYDNDEMYYLMGMAYEHMNDDNMALRYYQRACAKNPSRPDYVIKKIHVLFALGMYEDAEEASDDLILLAPELFDSYHIKTHLMMINGKAEEAVSFAKEASEKFPEDPELVYDYAQALVEADRLDDALKVIINAKKMKYFSDAKREFLIFESRILAQQGNTQEAVKCCMQCVDDESDGQVDAEARFLLMNFYLDEADFERSLEQAEKLVAADQEDEFYYAALYYRAFCNAQLGNETAAALYKTANSIYRLAALNDPGNLDAYIYRAMCLRDMEEYSKALEILSFLTDLKIEIAEIHILKADVYQKMGKNALYEEEMKEAYRIKPELRPEEVQNNVAGI